MPPKNWGPPIWYLIHGLTYNIKSEKVEDIHNLFRICALIISSLPCPKCSLDGMNIMKSVNLRNIKTKDDIIYIMFCVHNKVNNKLSKPQFKFDDFNTLYRRLNITKCIHQYKDIMTSRQMRAGNINHNWNMNKCIAKFMEYIILNKNLFL